MIRSIATYFWLAVGVLCAPLLLLIAGRAIFTSVQEAEERPS